MRGVEGGALWSALCHPLSHRVVVSVWVVSVVVTLGGVRAID